MKYEVEMSDGSVGEAHSLAAALVAAETMYADAEAVGEYVRVKRVRCSSTRPWKVGSGRRVNERMLWVLNQHLRERRDQARAAEPALPEVPSCA